MNEKLETGLTIGFLLSFTYGNFNHAISHPEMIITFLVAGICLISIIVGEMYA